MNERAKKTSPPKRQRGGFVVGLIVGLLIGLALALGVALYVTKVPVPFVNKVPQRTAVQDAAELEKNKNWDPNSPLYGKNPAKPATSASGVVAPDAPAIAAPSTAPPPAVPPTLPPPTRTASAPSSARDPAAILGMTAPVPPALAASRPAVRPITTTTPGSDPFTYFVQAGAYGRTEDAEQQRAKLAIMGIEGRVTERDQAGRTVYRVRVGPFDRKDDADTVKQKLDGAGVDAALVRVQR